MPEPAERNYQNRDRAESFGQIAEAYDRARPGYPDALIDDLVALGGPNRLDVLDVGTGTGRAAVALAARGCAVLGVEVDPQMAAVAAGNGVTVEVGGFEAWPAAGRTFDLLVCGQAWHWIDPVLGAAKAHELLRPGGHLALFWNIGDFDPAVQPIIDAVYQEVVPGMALSTLRGGNRAVEPHREVLRAAGFADLEHRRYPWDRRYSTAEWLDLARTHSDHSTLPPATLDRLLARLGSVVDELGGSLVAHYVTETLLATRPSVAG